MMIPLSAVRAAASQRQAALIDFTQQLPSLADMEEAVTAYVALILTLTEAARGQA